MKYLKLFEDYIVESLSEAPLQWSKDFERILYDIENPLVYQLLNSRLNPESITLLNPTIDGEYISYLPADKVTKRLKPENYNQLTTLIKPLVFGKELIYNDGNVLTRTGRVFKKLFPQATPSEIEKLTNEYKSKFEKKSWKFLEGEEIKKGYQSKSYSFSVSQSNPLMNSCMNDQLDLIDYYQYLPVRLLVLENEEGHILGRALIWKIKEGYLMDRVYYTHDKEYYLFTNYAKNEGWWWKIQNVSGADIDYTNGRETKWFPITIPAPIDSYQHDYVDSYQHDYDDNCYYGFPYMDTFWFGYNNTISNQAPSVGGYLKLTDTDGYPEWVGESILDVHGEVIDNPDDYVYSNTQGGLISMFNAIWVSYSDFNDYIESSYLKSRVNGFIQDEEGDWFRVQDCQFLKDGTVVYPQNKF